MEKQTKKLEAGLYENPKCIPVEVKTRTVLAASEVAGTTDKLINYDEEYAFI